MFSTWDLVRPPMWHPMSVLELSLMDDDELLRPLSMLSAAPLTTMMTLPTTTADDEFFKDLPIDQASAQEQQRAGTATPEEEHKRAFSSYSFSQSTVHDAQGRTIGSTRRRYEDSTGRLKAVHEREVDGRRLVTIWNKKDREDQGEHRAIASEGSAEEFETMWADTPFGKAHAQKRKQLEQEQAQQGQQQQQHPEHQKHHKHQQQHEAGGSSGGAKTEDTSSATPSSTSMGKQQHMESAPMTSGS